MPTHQPTNLRSVQTRPAPHTYILHSQAFCPQVCPWQLECLRRDLLVATCAPWLDIQTDTETGRLPNRLTTLTRHSRPCTRTTYAQKRHSLHNGCDTNNQGRWQRVPALPGPDGYHCLHWLAEGLQPAGQQGAGVSCPAESVSYHISWLPRGADKTRGSFRSRFDSSIGRGDFVTEIGIGRLIKGKQAPAGFLGVESGLTVLCRLG